MYRFLISVLWISAFLSLKAQTDYPPLELMIKVHPSNLVQINRPSLKGSVELKILDKLGLEFSYGKRYGEIYPFLLRYNRDSLVTKPQSTHLLYDLKWYHPFGRTPYENPFFVFTFGQINDVKNRKVRYYDDLILLTDYFSIHQAINIYALGYGTVINYNRFMLEVVFSIGLKNVALHWENNVYDGIFYRSKRDLFLWEYPGNKWLPYFNASFKMGFSTGKTISKIFSEDITDFDED